MVLRMCPKPYVSWEYIRMLKVEFLPMVGLCPLAAGVISDFHQTNRGVFIGIESLCQETDGVPAPLPPRLGPDGGKIPLDKTGADADSGCP